jgi:TonB-linked SusC/RagA family outer membrane protein
VEVGDQITLSVALGEDSQSLDEVVVVGYGTVRKRDLTGAISRISQDDIKNSSQGNILGRMQGRVAGVSINNIGGSEPGGGVSVQVRGISTFRDIDPLYIVDGIPVPNLNVINPNEIESLEVLKDASSSAIYGSRAAHGVVLVTTKKGRSDHQLITLNTYWGLTTPYNLPRMANADQYYDMVIEAYRNGGGELPATLEYMRGLGGNTDWWRELTDNSLMQNYDLGISGGSGKLTYSSNLGYRKEDGIILNTGYQRYSYRLNTEYKYNEAITIGSNVGVSKTIDEGVYTNVGQGQYLYSAYILDPLTPIYNPNADPTDPDYEINQYMNSTINTYASNPLSLVRRQTFTDDDLLLLGNLYADIKIYKGLSFTTNLGLNISNGQTKGFIKRYYHSPSDNRTNAQVREQIDKGNSLIWNNLIKYNRKTGLHAIDFVGGQTVERTQGSWVTAIREGTPSNAETNQVLSAATVNDQASGSIQESVLLSYLARVNYNYADKYLLTASIRRDGSSRFHKSNRWGTFPSFSAGWRITEETFFKNLKLDFITDVKFRAGWGATGNQQIADNAYLTLVGGGNEKRYVLGNPKAVYQGYGPSSTGNPDIKWETTTQTNIGADIMLWRNLSVTLDYYAKNTKDLLMQVPLPLLSGYPNDPWVNAGSIRNKGFEFAVSYDRYDMPLKHSIAFNVSTVSTEVTSLAGDQPISGTYSRSEVGKPFGQFYGYVMDGVFQSQAQIDAYTHDGNKIQPNALPGDFIFRDIAGAPDTDGNPTGPDGVINDNDRTFIGSPYPDFTFGLNISLEYKNIDFSMLVQGQYGNDVYYRRLWEAANGNGTYNILAEAYENAWRGEGTSNSYARFTSRDTNDNFRNSSWFVHDGSYIRIKNMQLGYSIPKSILSKTGLGKCRFYVSGTNLLTLTKYPGRDPEIGNRNPMSVGVDTDIYPQTRVFTGGIEIEF